MVKALALRFRPPSHNKDQGWTERKFPTSTCESSRSRFKWFVCKGKLNRESLLPTFLALVKLLNVLSTSTQPSATGLVWKRWCYLHYGQWSSHLKANKQLTFISRACPSFARTFSSTSSKWEFANDNRGITLIYFMTEHKILIMGGVRVEFEKSRFSASPWSKSKSFASLRATNVSNLSAGDRLEPSSACKCLMRCSHFLAKSSGSA